MSESEEEEAKGKIIRNKYEVIKKLGEGSYGKVYLVKDIKTKEPFVIKKSKKEKCRTFEREINMLNKLSQYKTINNINLNDSYTINMIENFEEIDFDKKEENKIKKYIVFEYKSRKSLFEYFDRIEKSISEKYAKAIFYKIAKGVQEIHNAGICHLDLKLDNIILDESYKGIICDFGFACENSNELRVRRGTIGYMAPEVLTRKTFKGFNADIFSLGAVLLKLVTGKEIFKNKNMFNPNINENFRKYRDDFYKYIQENNIDKYWEVMDLQSLNLSVEFKNLFQKMIHFIPSRRPTIAQILNDPWMAEYNNLTDKEKFDLEKEITENEFKVREKLIAQKNKENEAEKKDLQIGNDRGIGEDFEEYFKESLEIKNIEEINLDMKYYFKINGDLNPKDFMNELSNKLLKIKREDEIRNFDIFPDDVYYKLYLAFENENKEIPQGLESLEFTDYDEYAKIFGMQDLTIQIQLFKSNKGYLIRVIKKEGSAEDFNEYLEKIMNTIKSIF